MQKDAVLSIICVIIRILVVNTKVNDIRERFSFKLKSIRFLDNPCSVYRLSMRFSFESYVTVNTRQGEMITN